MDKTNRKPNPAPFGITQPPQVELNGIPTEEWANAIATRLQDELPFGEDNVIVASAVEQFLTDYPHYTEQFVGTAIIEEDYFKNL